MTLLRWMGVPFALTTGLLSFGQAGDWTWMSGDSSSTPTAFYGTLGESSPLTVPAPSYEATEWKDLNGNFWLYDNHDLWMLDPTELAWTWFGGSQGVTTPPNHGAQGVSAVTNHPGWRRYGCASWVDASNNLWLYGGESTDGVMNDLWRFSTTTHEWTWLKGDTLGNEPPRFGEKGIAGATVNPSGVAETNASWVDEDNNLWLFGGDGYDTEGIDIGAGNTLWKFSITENN